MRHLQRASQNQQKVVSFITILPTTKSHARLLRQKIMGILCHITFQPATLQIK
jgi:hypothetical protein